MRFYLRRVYLNQGGYDRHGVYFGRGGKLYEYWNDDAYGHVRAYDRADAKIAVANMTRNLTPNPTFFN